MASTRVTSTGPEKDRVITSFPLALFPDASPYRQFSFSAQHNLQDIDRSVPRSAKLVVVGDIAVGKTSLINRFVHSVFDADYKATIGVDFEVEKFSVMSVPYTLNIWDTAGHERFKCIAASYYRGASAVVVVFDMSLVATLHNAVQWKREACINAGTDEKDQFVFLVGTKRDLISDTACQDVQQQALEVAAELNAEYWTVSSKTGLNVKQLFFRIVALNFERTVSQEVPIYRERPKKSVGDDLIRVRQSTREEEDAWKKLRTRLKCCR